MTFVDRSLGLIRRAVQVAGKKPVAAEAGVSDSLLREVHEDDYAPTAVTMRKLEKAARKFVPDDIQ